MRGHVKAETLAAFREGLLSRRKAARVSAHLAACSRCAGLDAQLTEVSALLTRSTAPPMPDALTARIEAAIAAEAAGRAATAADGGVAAAPARAGAHARDRATRPSRQWAGRATGPRRSILALRVAAVTAAVVVVAGASYGVAKLLSASPSGTAARVAAPESQAKGAPPRSVGGLGAPTNGGKAAAGSAGAGSSAPAAQIVSSGTNYRPGQLKSQVSAVLAQHRANITAGPSPSSPGNLRASPRQSACIAQVTGGKHPRLVDLAKYQGRPATVIVVPAGAPGTLRVLVVADRCTATTSHILATTIIPAPG